MQKKTQSNAEEDDKKTTKLSRVQWSFLLIRSQGVRRFACMLEIPSSLFSLLLSSLKSVTPASLPLRGVFQKQNKFRWLLGINNLLNNTIFEGNKR